MSGHAPVSELQPGVQLDLFPVERRLPARRANGAANRLDAADRAFHDWYRFVLSFPPHLVREYVSRFNLKADDTLLDPF